jgi:serine/threonine protein kinase
MTSIRKMLLKIMPSTPDAKVMSSEDSIVRNTANDKYKGKVEINSYSDIETECNIQKDVYRTSILGERLPLVPVCPAILYLENPVSNGDEFKGIISGKLLPRNNRTVLEEEEELMQFLNVAPQSTFSIIAMELLDGYAQISDVIHNIWGNINISVLPNYIAELVDVEIFRLHSMGYYHGDLHLGNIMYNTEKDYSSPNKGKAIIIDFGRTTKDLAKLPDECTKNKMAMISNDCFSTEKIHEITPVTTIPVLLAKLKAIAEKNNDKLSKVSGKLLYPGKNLNESLMHYVEHRVYNGGGMDNTLDVDYIREILYGMIMQNDTPDTFDIVNYLKSINSSSIMLPEGSIILPEVKNIVDVSSRVPISVTSGGKKRKTTNRKRKTTNRKRKTTNRKRKTSKSKSKK